MSVLDIDEAIIPIAKRIEVVYGPLVDAQEFPKAWMCADRRPPSARRKTWKKCGFMRQRSNWWSPGRLRGDRQRSRHAQSDRSAKTAERIYIEGVQENPGFPPRVFRRCCATPSRCTKW